MIDEYKLKVTRLSRSSIKAGYEEDALAFHLAEFR
jgi:hypothetical protein